MGDIVIFCHMKQKLCVTVDEKLIRKLEDRLGERVFRNKSHIVELALAKWLEEK